MALPCKEVFDNYLDHIWVMPSDVLEEIKNLRTPDEKQITSICLKLDSSLSEHLERQRKSPVRIWLEGQKNYMIAMKKLTLKSNNSDKKIEYLNNRTTEIKKLFDQTHWDVSEFSRPIDTNSKRQKAYEDIHKFLAARNAEKSLKNFLEYYSLSGNYSLHFDIVKCLYDYFYTDRATLLFELNDTGNHLLNQTRRNLNKLSELAAYGELAVGTDLSKTPITGNTYKRFVRQIQDIEFKLPFKRNDKTLKERVLIFDLSRAINKYFRTSKTDAIYNLLMLEGIVHNIEKRNIEKMLSKWNRH